MTNHGFEYDFVVIGSGFGGRGPQRTGCTFCGSCMVGCPVGAKNTLDKNYLYLAEGCGAEIIANEVTRRLAKRMNGIPLSSIPEAIFNASTTAHILGGLLHG